MGRVLGRFTYAPVECEVLSLRLWCTASRGRAGAREHFKEMSFYNRLLRGCVDQALRNTQMRSCLGDSEFAKFTI